MFELTKKLCSILYEDNKTKRIVGEDLLRIIIDELEEGNFDEIYNYFKNKKYKP